MMVTVKNIFLTGEPSIGKTTALKKALSLTEVRSGGFYTEEKRRGGERVGFDIVTIGGQRRAMAEKGLASSCRVGRYGIDIAAIDALAAGSIREAIADSDLIVIDEIGKMELFSDQFKSAVIEALNSRKPVVGIIMKRGNDFADQIKSRDDVEVTEVTLENRDQIPNIVKIKIEELIKH